MEPTDGKIENLTPRQREVYHFIREKIKGRGFGPTVREIGVEFGIKSPDGVTCHLRAIEVRGLVHREPNMTRMVERIARSSANLIVVDDEATRPGGIGGDREANGPPAVDQNGGAESPPRFWELFAFVLPRDLRERNFEPLLGELAEDFLLTRKTCRTDRERRWHSFAFGFRFAAAAGGSLRAWAGGKSLDLAGRLAALVFGEDAVRLLRAMIFKVFRQL